MKNKLVMIFPPGWTPFAPFLALPQLKGYLNENGLDADIIDENINFFDMILSKSYLEEKCKFLIELFDKLNYKVELNDEEKALFERIIKIKLYKDQIMHIDEYKNHLRNSNNGLTKKSYKKIMQVFSVALEIVNIWYNQKIDFTDINYKIYRRDNINDILNAINDHKNNIFLDYYSNYRIELLNQLCKYEIVGLSITSGAQLIPALTLCKIIKKINPDIIIFLGGNYITRLVQQRQENLNFIFNYIDFISCYEGEYTIQQLVEGKLSRNNFEQEMDEIYNAVYLKDNKFKFTLKKSFEISDLKCPNFDGFNLELYFNQILVLPLIASKNCYSNCAFCTISSGTGGKNYRPVNINLVSEYMQRLREKYNTRYFTFVDETFTFKRMLELSKLLVKNKTNDFLWYTETRFDYALSESEGKLLYEGGLRKLQFGLESYNQRILDLMNKRIKKENIRPILESCMKNHISFHLFYIIGFPGETKEEALETINFVEGILEEAENYYNLQECSKGISPFGLEKGSRVCNYPDDYKIEIMQDEKNNIGLTYNFISKEGLSENESAQLMKEVLQDDNYKIGVQIPINRLLGEEFSLFFDEQSKNEKAMSYTKDFEKEKCFKLYKNPFLNEEKACFIYYSFENDYTLILNNPPEKLSNFEQAIMKIYGFSTCNKDNNEYFEINPFIKFDKQEEGNIIAYDTVSEDKYSLNEFTYETLLFLDKMTSVEARNILYRNIFTKEEYCDFLHEVKNTRLLIDYKVEK